MYHSRDGQVLGGWYVDGDLYGSNELWDGETEGGISMDDLDELFGEVPRYYYTGESRKFYRLTITGIPNRDSPPSTRDGCEDGPPISRSFAKTDYDVFDALKYTEDQGPAGTAEVFASALTGPDEIHWCRVDRIEVVDYTPKVQGQTNG